MKTPRDTVAGAALAYAEALFNYRHVCEALGVDPVPLDELKERARTSTRSIVQVVDDEKRATIERYQARRGDDD